MYHAHVFHFPTLRASSYRLGQPGWLGFRDLTSSLFPSLFRCVYVSNPAGPVTEISVFATEISVTEMKIFPYEHGSPGVTGTKRFSQHSFAFAT